MKTAASEDSYRDRLKARLIQITEGVIASHGLSGVQARKIAQEAECSVGTIYNIFGDIDGLILTANALTLHNLGLVLTAAAKRSAACDLETRLTALAIAYLDFATVNQSRWRAVFEHRLPDATPVPESYVGDRRRLLALIEAQVEGSIVDPTARSDAAHALFSAVHGIVLMSLDAKLGPFEPDRCDRQIRFLVGNVVKGLV